MNQLTDAEVAWLAGIYEGEGSCVLTKGRAFSVQLLMTDFDVMERVHALTGIGSLSPSGPNWKHKPYLTWRVGSRDAIDFLTAIMPWLGERRRVRATEAIHRWHSEKQQASRNDTHCLYGHEFNELNWRNKDGSCHLCANEASRRYRERKRARSAVEMEVVPKI